MVVGCYPTTAPRSAAGLDPRLSRDLPTPGVTRTVRLDPSRWHTAGSGWEGVEARFATPFGTDDACSLCVVLERLGTIVIEKPTS